MSTPRDGKGQFYRKLELDKKTMKLIRDYRNIKRYIDQDIITTQENYDRTPDGRGIKPS